MPTYKNIRVKKPNGGSRMQRVQVLKSGKYKFVKNKSKAQGGTKRLAKARPSGRRAKPSAKRSRSYSRKGGPRMSKKRKFTLPLGLLIPGGVGTYSTIKDCITAYQSGGASEALRFALLRTTGFDVSDSAVKVREAHFTIGWGAGAAIHKGVGSYMGVNRALGAARVPFVRI